MRLLGGGCERYDGRGLKNKTTNAGVPEARGEGCFDAGGRILGVEAWLGQLDEDALVISEIRLKTQKKCISGT